MIECCICGKSIMSYGNNAEPVMVGECCNECNLHVVIPARMMELIKYKED